jgi:HEAT repeat protein
VDLFTAFLLLFFGSVALLVALVSLVVGRKALRDRRESASSRRRRRYHAAFAAGDRKILRTALGSVRGAHAEVDLAVVLQDSARAAVDAAVVDIEARRSGLMRRLHRRLRSRHASVRGRAVLILGHLRVAGRVGPLEAMLDDKDPDVRLATVAGLPLAHDDEAVGALVRALSRRQLAPERVIERVGQPWAVGALLDALRALDEAGERRAAPRMGVARALGVAGDRRAEPALIELLRHGVTEERISAARALGSVGGRRSRPELEPALKDPSWPLRAQAAKALGTIGIHRSAPALEAVLDDPAWWVRANAASALLNLGAPGHAALQRTLSHADAYARDRAREALAINRLGERAA